MNYACSMYDSVTIDTADDIGTQIYIIDVDEGTAHQQLINPSVTHLHTGTTCTMSVEYFYWDDDAYDWKLITGSDYDNNPFYNMDAVGEITLATLDDGTVTLRPIHTVHVRVAYTADMVKAWRSERTVYDDFDVIFKEDCSDNTITLGTPINDIEYYVGQTTIDYPTITDFQI